MKNLFFVSISPELPISPKIPNIANFFRQKTFGDIWPPHGFYLLFSEYKRAERGNALENYNFDFEKEVFKPGQIGLNYDSQPVKTSVYAHFYRRWLNNFPSSQLLLIDGNELKKTPWTSVQKVEDFLNLPSMVTEDDFIFKEERGFFCIRNDPVYGERCLSASKGRSHIEVSDATRAKLRKMYKHHNEDFYKLVDRRFDWDD
jgi:hypothetical protein